MPAWMPLTRVSISEREVPKMLAPRAWGVEFAMCKASGTEKARMRTQMGAKSSSCAMRIAGVTSTRRVGAK